MYGAQGRRGIHVTVGFTGFRLEWTAMDAETSSAVDSEPYSGSQRDTVLIAPGVPPVSPALPSAARKSMKPRSVSVLTAAVVTSGWAAVISFLPIAVLVVLSWLLD